MTQATQQLVTVTVDNVEYQVEQSIADVIIQTQSEAASDRQEAERTLENGNDDIAPLWIAKAEQTDAFNRMLISYHFQALRGK